MQTNSTLKRWSLVPIVGILLFMMLYWLSAYFYPGGSDADKSSIGFDWRDNYWCELLAQKAQNGQQNSGRPAAVVAMLVLAISLGIFWQVFSISFHTQQSKYIRYAGILSMMIALFLFIGPHDPIMIGSGLLGLTALSLVIWVLYQRKQNLLVGLGIICILMCVVNNYIYYTGNGFTYLALIQKFTFLLFFGWFIAVSLFIYRINPANPV